MVSMQLILKIILHRETIRAVESLLSLCLVVLWFDFNQETIFVYLFTLSHHLAHVNSSIFVVIRHGAEYRNTSPFNYYTTHLVCSLAL